MIARFLLILALLHGGYQAERRLLDGRVFDMPYTRWVTIAAFHLGQWILPFDIEQRGEITIGTRVVSTPAEISIPTQTPAAVLIRGGCNGIEALFLLLAGVLALPAPWNIRLTSLARDLFLLFGLNLLRILGLLYTMARHPGWIDVAHDQIAQGVMIVLVLLLWVRYLERIQSLPGSSPHPASGT